MQFKTLHIRLLLAAFSLLAVISCSTEKDALLNKGYHNMTARYNGYYNARVIIKEALDDYAASFQEDYSKIIPLDLYPNEEDVANMYPELEDAIKRCSHVVVRHSMPNPAVVKNKSDEKCRWIDDNWLVIGKAYYIKREYEEAKEKLKFVSESEFYRSEESIYEARIWLAKTHIALGEYPEAKRVLISVNQSIERAESAKEDKEKKKKPSKLERQRAKKKGKKKEKGPADFPKKLKVDYEIAMADLYLAQNENKNAIKHLENAIVICKDKKRRARYMFALAQLYAKQGNGANASKYFTKVGRSNAPYEMRFKAKINNALNATTGSEELVKELNKMLKDGKNLEFKDQIYYALAELDMKNSDVKAAKSNYTNSVTWSIKNNKQKGISYLRLADISFDEADYLSAQRYYDSCVQALPEDYEGYELLKNKAAGLADLVYHYETVKFEDSVQNISKMSPRDREKFLEKTVKDIAAEKERKRLEDEQRLLAQQARINNQQGAVKGGGKKWYFSNPKQVASGFNEYRNLWGQRLLEDNWRRINKSSFTEFLNENGEPVDSAVVADGVTVEMLMKDIPLTEAAIDSSNNRIMNSLYNLGIIYKDQLKEENEAVSYFQAVIDRDIEHTKVLPAMYQLYLINKKNGNAKAGGYKSTIISDYPKSEIAQILLDPDYLKKKEIKDREELNEYSGVLRNYRRRSYGLVISKCNEIIKNDSANQFINKYYLLKAFAISKVSPGNTVAISDPLQKLYDFSPESEEGIQAKIYLSQLNNGNDIVKPDDVEEVDSPYTYDAASKHFLLVVVKTGTGNLNNIKIKVSNFNNSYFPTDGLSLQSAPLGDENSVIVVRSFKNLEKANLYNNAFNGVSAKELLGTIPADHEICLINTNNFKELFKSKDLEEYLKFYKEKYK